jgi:hypothetical protein
MRVLPFEDDPTTSKNIELMLTQRIFHRFGGRGYRSGQVV